MINVLLVDDDTIILKALSQALRLQFFKVTCLADGSKVLTEMAKEKYDVIVLDIVMPNKEGLETIEDIREVNKDIPILAVSGGGQTMPELNLSTAQVLGATGILTKPFDSVTLAHKIRQVLNN